MFVQVMRAFASDVEGLRRQWDDWVSRLAPGAEGWLGSSGGVSTQGEFVAVARFESEEAARRNSDRPEQGEWWAAVEACLSGPATFEESDDVSLLREGGSDEAGFVQVMQATVRDRARLEDIESQMIEEFERVRPDLIGGLRAWHPGDRLTVVDWFTSEAEAREGEKQELPGELRDQFKAWVNLLTDTRWYDLTDPWLASP